MEVIAKPNIKDMIYEIRGYQVMLDSDLAKLYGCKNGTKEVNQAVRNNLNKFPKRYCFRLNDEESKLFLVKNFDQKNIETRGGKYNNPRVFTEEGILMLSTILKTNKAIETSIMIMDTFVSMRKLINSNLEYFNEITTMRSMLLIHDEKINELFDIFEEKKVKNNKIFFSEEIYNAYSLLIKLIGSAKEKIIIIDNYLDNSILDVLTKKKSNIEVILVTKGTNINKLDIDKFNKEYPNIKLVINNSFHDRFIIIDNSLYHLGASLKYLGNKCFAINKIEDENYLNILMEVLWK